jgi:uncharacterized protein YndB with AHSA1/START domain
VTRRQSASAARLIALPFTSSEGPRLVPNRKLVWTVALGPGYRPSNPTFDVPLFTAVITLEPHGNGTKYRALAMHKDEQGRNAHDRMGFGEGWGKALDQLVAYAKTIPNTTGDD